MVNFFEDQEHARKETKKFLVLYLFTVIFICALTGLFACFIHWTSLTYEEINTFEMYLLQPFAVKVFGVSFVFIALTIAIVTWIKIAALSNPGAYIARQVGAVPVDYKSNKPLVRKYINIIEEMAIASGSPLPQIFIIPNENGINAFAAGYSIHDAAIAVTDGTLKKLNRDELQGVVAHEFSHIFNGDMKLNIRLIGVLAGLTALFEAGRLMTRSRSRSSSKKGNSIVLVGLGLMVIGGLGMFCAALLKASISRQREYLADASSVQFTRNPDGIGGALKKIACDYEGSFVKAAGVGEMSHFFFSSVFKKSFFNFDTHPPLYRRLKAVYPNFRKRHFEKVERPLLLKAMNDESFSNENNVEKKGRENKLFDVLLPGALGLSKQRANVDVDLGHAKDVISEIPKDLHIAIHDPKQVIDIVWGLFSLESPGLRVSHQQEEWARKIKAFEVICPMELLSLCSGGLKSLARSEQKKLLRELKLFLEKDSKVTTSEYLMFVYLRVFFNSQSFFSKEGHTLLSLKSELRLLLSFLAYIGTDNELEAKESFKSIFSTLYSSDQNAISKKEIKFTGLTKSFKKLRSLNPRGKELLMRSCVKLIKKDDIVNQKESQSIRLFCQVLNIPFPSL